jgi:cell wall-associated NlpC family hydrolase
MRQLFRGIGCLGLVLLCCGCISLKSTAQTRSTNQGKTGRQSDALSIARQYLGTPYRYGGSDPRGFDCSGFVLFVFRQLGITLPHNAADQFARLPAVSQPQPGDLVFFHTYGSGVSHVGIYAGDNRFIHSPRSGKTVEYTDMRIDYWRTRYRGARRAE